MNAWSLLLVPFSLAMLSAVLAGTAWLENKMLSPDQLIRASARSRRAPAEHVEAFVAAQAELLLRDLGDA